MDLLKKLLLAATVLFVAAGSYVLYQRWFDTKGFAVTLTLDQDRYRLHEGIPMHVGCIRTTNDWTVFAPDSASLCDAYIEIRDEKGMLMTAYIPPPGMQNTAPAEQKIDRNYTVLQDITLPYEITSSNIYHFTIPFSRRVTGYTFTAIWHAHSRDAHGDVEAIVRSKPVAIHIIPDE